MGAGFPGSRAVRAGAPILALAAIVGATYAPGLRGFWGRDDFMQLAFARLIGSPWPLFVQDHYVPAPGAFFRPVGFASFWLWQAWFGTNYTAHAMADMLLHLAVGVALMGVLRAAGTDRLPALLCALLFAVHPAALGTALWWSARFDLLAALFMLLSLHAAIGFARRGTLVHLAGALLAALAAVLSKESALVLVVLLAFAGWREAPLEARRVRALLLFASVCAIAVIFVAWRWAVLGTLTSGLVGVDTSLPVVLAKGAGDWLRNLPAYLSSWPRLDTVERVAGALALAFSGVIVVSILAAAPRPRCPSPQAGMLVCGLVLFLMPAVLQAPVTALNAKPLGSAASAVEAAMQSRLYYLSMIGFAMAAAGIIGWAWQSGSRATRTALATSLGALIAVLAVSSRHLAAGYATTSSASANIARAVVAAMGSFAPTSAPCHVFLLGAPQPPEWGALVSMDAIAKALTPEPRDIERCFVHSGDITYFHLMGRGVDAPDAAPFRARRIDGQVVPWLRVGEAVVAYVDPPDPVTPAALAGAVFMHYENGRFRDVTADVNAGRFPLPR